MVDFTLSEWLRLIPRKLSWNARRKSRQVRLARVEGLEQRAMLTATLPVAVADVYTVNEDTTLTAPTVLSNDTDADGDTIDQAVLGTTTANGVLNLNTNGTFTYTPNANFNGVDTFTYQARDSLNNENSLPTLVTINVTAVNDAPVATPSNITTAEDTPAVGTVSGTDVDGNPLTYSAGSTAPANGSVVIAPNGTFTYTPNANFHGTDTFTFKANDLTVDSADAVVTVTITSVNDVPVANSTTITTNEDTTFGGTLTATDADGDTLVYSTGSVLALHGMVNINPNGTYSYTPAPDYNGPDSFSFRVNDGTVNSVDAFVTVIVTAVNDAPVATPSNITTAEDTPAVGTVSGTDADGNPLTYSTGATAPAHGTVVIAPNGTFTYTPDANFSGSDSFTFKANDGTTNSADATVNVTVTAVNDAPVANLQSITTNEDTTFSGTLTATDADGDTLTYSAGLVAATHGTVTINPNGTFTYAPAANYNGPDSFSFKVNDGTVNSVDALVTVTVTAVNDAPIATPTNITTNEDTPVVGTLSATDADNDVLTYAIGANTPNHGTVVIAPNGTFTYTPDANYNGTDTFSFTANDGTTNSAPATVTITITGVNDAPVVVDGSNTQAHDTQFSGSLSPLGTDVDGDSLTYIAVTQPLHGTLSLSPDGNFNYTPALGFTGTDFFTFKANDGQADSNIATYTLNVTTLFVLELSPVPGTIATSVKAAVPLDNNAHLINVSPTVNFGNASISAGIISGGDKRDRIFITDGAGGGGTIDARGRRILFNGVEVARLTGGRRGNDLQISFKGNATLDAVDAVLQRISVKTSKHATRATRTVQIRVSAGGETSSATIDANVA